MNTSITVANVITKITGNSVSTHKMNEFSSLLSNCDTITLNGTCTPSKKEKYNSLMIESGFYIYKILWSEVEDFGLNTNPIRFSIIYKRN